MSYQAEKWAKAQDLADDRGKGVLLALAEVADADGVCFPSARRLAQWTGEEHAHGQAAPGAVAFRRLRS